MAVYVVIAEIECPAGELLLGAISEGLEQFEPAVTEHERRLDVLLHVESSSLERAIDDVNLAVWEHLGVAASAFRYHEVAAAVPSVVLVG